MPAYNAGKTLEKTYSGISREIVDEMMAKLLLSIEEIVQFIAPLLKTIIMPPSRVK